MNHALILAAGVEGEKRKKYLLMTCILQYVDQQRNYNPSCGDQELSSIGQQHKTSKNHRSLKGLISKRTLRSALYFSHLEAPRGAAAYFQSQRSSRTLFCISVMETKRKKKTLQVSSQMKGKCTNLTLQYFWVLLYCVFTITVHSEL